MFVCQWCGGGGCHCSGQELRGMRCGVYSNAMKSEMLLGGDLAALQLFDLSRSQVVKEVPHTPMIRAHSDRPSGLIFLAKP